MTVSDPVYIAFMVTALGSLAYATYRASSSHPTPGAKLFAYNSAVNFVTILCLLFMGLSLSDATASFWLRLRLFSQLLAGALFFLFVLEYVGYTAWLTPSRTWIIFAFPVISAIVLFSPLADEWVLVQLDFERQEILLYERYQNGWAFTVGLVYSYILFISTLTLLAIQIARSQAMYRWQASVLFFVSWLGAALNIILFQGLGQAGQFVINPVLPQLFIHSGVVTWALFRLNFLDIAPMPTHIIMKGMSESIVVLDEQLRIITVNDAALKLTGRLIHEVIGQPVSRYFPALEMDKYNRNDERWQEISLTINRKLLTFESRIHPFVREDNRRVGHILSFIDITQRKKEELEREQLIADLDAYAHTVAHDLKSPISVMIGFSEMLLDPQLELEEKEREFFVDRIRYTSYRMFNIVTELLLLSSMRSMSEVPLAALDMNALVKDVLLRIDPILKEHQAEVVVQTSFPSALGHRGWVEEVWVNYITNAIKYGGVPPRIELGADSRPNKTICFWVRDNGQGLTPEQQAKLFQKFSRIGQPRAEGHGLGLSIVRRIVEKLGGTVGVESLVAQGSTFYFVLNAAETNEPSQNLQI